MGFQGQLNDKLRNVPLYSKSKTPESFLLATYKKDKFEVWGIAKLTRLPLWSGQSHLNFNSTGEFSFNSLLFCEIPSVREGKDKMILEALFMYGLAL